MTFKQINIENRPYYFFNDIINIKNFNPNMLSIDKISFKSIDSVIYNIKYITMKNLNHVNIDNENRRYLIFNNVDRHIDVSNGDKYLVFPSTEKNKEVFKKYTKLWDEIKNQIETINDDKPIEHKKDFMNIGFESDDNLPLDKILSILGTIIVVGFVFQEDNKYYPQVLPTYMNVCMNLWLSYKEYAIFVQYTY